MNFTFKKVTVCLLIIFSVFLFYKNADAVKPCDVDASEDCEYEAVYISVSDLKTKIDAGEKNLAILDVRQGVEYVDAHIQGALSLPLSDVKKNAEAKVAKDKEIVTYCSATECQASLSAAKKLHDLGYRNIKILEGGFPAWENEGYKVNSGWEDDRTFAKGGLTSESIALGTVIGIGRRCKPVRNWYACFSSRIFDSVCGQEKRCSAHGSRLHRGCFCHVFYSRAFVLSCSGRVQPYIAVRGNFKSYSFGSRRHTNNRWRYQCQGFCVLRCRSKP